MEPQQWRAEVKATTGKWCSSAKAKSRCMVSCDHGMVIVSGYGRHKERRLGSSPPEFIARLLLAELANAARGQADQKTESPE
jgi:hypothetical protein